MEKMRLDKYLSNAKVLSRKDCVKAIKNHEITVNGVIATKKEQIVSDTDVICYKDNKIVLKKFIYIMLNKPQGYVSSTDDPRDKTVLELLPDEYLKYNLFPCGRLDKDTTGLIILTNDGIASHHLLSPKYHVEKTYYFELADSCNEQDKNTIEQGVCLRDGYTTKPCKINLINDKSGNISITEGKYHEIKRMFGFTGNKVTKLERISFGTINLDPALKEGEFRLLNKEEQKLFESIKN